VLDSPHSGNVYPKDFRYDCPKAWLAETEDAFVDEIFGQAPQLGVPLLSALFPRCYIDANRAEDDIDPLLLEGTWPGTANPTARSSMGVGLIRRLFKQNDPQPIYSRPLTVAEIEQRINTYYRPYHKVLADLLEATHRDFGAVYHLNCHSMPCSPGGATRHMPDIVLGDRDGTTCDASFTQFAAKSLKEMGYRVAINKPYKGVEILHRHGNPAQNRHSLQIELRRGLYMDEASRRKTPGFARMRKNMTLFVTQMIDFTRKNSIDLAAD
jgi:N-formylglutamate amidohydrolase